MIDVMDLSLSTAAIFLAVWNVLVFLFYGFDKQRAKTGGRRIREQTLVTMAFFMGGVGAFIGMKFFHHKTKHKKFVVLIPLALLFNGVMLILIIKGL